MNLLLIKIGKAWHTLRREGVMRGGKRVLTAGLAMFRLVPKAEILFITGGVGDSARYRTEHVAEELRAHGFSASTTVQDNPLLSSYADKFSVFIFHRVLHTSSVEKLIRRIEEKNKEIIFETDDLVYDPYFLKFMDYYAQMNAFERKLYENGVGGGILNDPYVTTATTTTDFLANKLRDKGKRVFVVKNKLSEQDVSWGEMALKNVKKDSAIVRLCYLSGTISHNKDFATITRVLVELLRKYSHLRLVLAGPLDVNNELQEFASQIERVPFLSREAYFMSIANYDINVAPLEIGNPFCESKSELKFFEAGLVQVPTVAAGTQTFKDAVTDGVDGFVAATKEEWKEKIEKLITDSELRRKMGENARQAILMRYTTKNAQDLEYYSYLRSKIKNVSENEKF